MSNKKTICITNVDDKSWKKFRGNALMNGWGSGSEWLRHLIKKYGNGEISESK